jgi:hypothetical protein
LIGGRSIKSEEFQSESEDFAPGFLGFHTYRKLTCPWFGLCGWTDIYAQFED